MCSFSLQVLFFFFKQKTAYEMRISDWSSDVCSSDLVAAAKDQDADAFVRGAEGLRRLADLEVDERRLERRGQRAHLDIVARHDARPQLLRHRVGAAAAGDGACRFGELAGELGCLCLDRKSTRLNSSH